MLQSPVRAAVHTTTPSSCSRWVRPTPSSRTVVRRGRRNAPTRTSSPTPSTGSTGLATTSGRLARLALRLAFRLASSAVRWSTSRGLARIPVTQSSTPAPNSQSRSSRGLMPSLMLSILLHRFFFHLRRIAVIGRQLTGFSPTSRRPLVPRRRLSSHSSITLYTRRGLRTPSVFAPSLR